MIGTMCCPEIISSSEIQSIQSCPQCDRIHAYTIYLKNVKEDCVEGTMYCIRLYGFRWVNHASFSAEQALIFLLTAMRQYYFGNEQPSSDMPMVK